MKKKIAVIGCGFSGLSAAAYLAKGGNEAHVFEKHAQPGGRARQFTTEHGYVFDMGQAGTGCLILWKVFLLISTAKLLISLS